MKTAVPLVGLAISIASALAADPPPINQVEDILELIPAGVRPVGKKEWDASSLAAASKSLTENTAGRTATLRLSIRPITEVPKGEFPVRIVDETFQFHGKVYRIDCICTFPESAYAALMKAKASDRFKISGTITECSLGLFGRIPNVIFRMKDCAATR